MEKRFYFIATIFLISLVLTGFISASTNVILKTPDTENLDDSYVINISGGGDINYGTSTYLRTDNGSFISLSYYKFNLSSIPSGSTIISADLSLYLYDLNSASPSFDMDIYNLTTFSEEEITWNNRPSLGYLQDHEDSLWTIGETWHTFDVTKAVNSSINDGKDNVSLATVTPEIGNLFSAYAYSKEYTTDTSLRPYLNITYDEPPAPSGRFCYFNVNSRFKFFGDYKWSFFG